MQMLKRKCSNLINSALKMDIGAIVLEIVIRMQ